MRFPFQTTTEEKAVRLPLPSPRPVLKAGSVAVSYAVTRMAGDFCDLQETSEPRLVVILLLDIAGRRSDALGVAAAVQERYRARIPDLFNRPDVNQADALTDLLMEINRGLLEASSGVRCTPAFLACYEEGLGTLTYINAGHEPALLRDGAGVVLLESHGPPLGLFSHTTYDAQHSVLEPGAALLVASRGLIDARNGRKEFGIERLKETLLARPFSDAAELCGVALEAVRVYVRGNPPQDDMTTVALVRAPLAYFTAAHPLL
jgi:hypothetical protein